MTTAIKNNTSALSAAEIPADSSDFFTDDIDIVQPEVKLPEKD